MQLSPPAASHFFSTSVVRTMQPSTGLASEQIFDTSVDVPVVTPAVTTPTEEPTPIQEPGSLLQDLERRQDEVLEQLDELDEKIKSVLKGLGATLDESDE